ncbi:MAG: glycosyltransferase family 39 protein [Ignavibacteriales bacterium]|nr:glycosyltransferase family 39 protein [Ignavibacteriales bacterium]
MASTSTRRFSRLLFAVLALALFVRLGFLYRNWNNLDFAASYLMHAEVARNILNGHWFQLDQQHLQDYLRECTTQSRLIDQQDFPPPAQEHLVPLYNDEGGYGLLLAAIWKITGSHRWWYVRLLQVLLDVLMCWFVYRIGRQVFNERTGLIAAFAYACFIPGIELAVRPHRDIWVTFLFIITVYQLTAIGSGPHTWWRILGIGIATGIVAWMRSTVLLFVILMIPMVFVMRPPREALRFSFLLLVGFVLTFSPLVVRNYVVFNKFMATRGVFWHSFWAGVGQMPNPYAVRDDDETIIRFARSLDSSAQYETDYYEQVLKREALTYVSIHPFLYAGSVLKRGVVFVFPKIGRELFFQPQLPQHVTGTLNTSFGKIMLMIVDGLFTGCFLAGLWLTRRRWRDLAVLCYPYVYTLVTLAPFYLVGRNIMNVYFVVLIVGSVTLSYLWDRFKPAPSSAS